MSDKEDAKKEKMLSEARGAGTPFESKANATTKSVDPYANSQTEKAIKDGLNQRAEELIKALEIIDKGSVKNIEPKS
jgi:hypothetical protein